MSGPLDFEVEDLLLNTSAATAKRKKVIDLDDLLADYYTKQSEIDSNAHKKSKASKRYNSEDEDDKSEQGNETKFSEIADECEKQMKQIITENEIPLWGQEIFGQQFYRIGELQASSDSQRKGTRFRFAFEFWTRSWRVLSRRPFD